MRESIALEPASLSALFICTRNLVLKSEAKNAIAIKCIIKRIKEIIIIFIYTNINCFPIGNQIPTEADRKTKRTRTNLDFVRRISKLVRTKMPLRK